MRLKRKQVAHEIMSEDASINIEHIRCLGRMETRRARRSCL